MTSLHHRLGVAFACAATAFWVFGPSSALARSCSVVGSEQKLGPTYTTRLSATKETCARAKTLVKAHYACRVRAGGRKGRCRTRVRGYTCRERRTAGIPTQFDAHVTCTNGGRRVVFDYTQYT